MRWGLDEEELYDFFSFPFHVPIMIFTSAPLPDEFLMVWLLGEYEPSFPYFSSHAL